MKRTIVILGSVAVIIASIFSVLPAIAGESQDNTMTGNHGLSQPFYSPNALSGSSITEHNYVPYMKQAGKTFTFSLLATDPDNNLLVYSASNLPPGATFDSQTRTFSWTPGYDQAGIYPNIRFEVSNGGFIDSEDITITVVNMDRPPELGLIGDKFADEGQLINFIINAIDPDSNPLVYSASNLPPGSTFDPQTRAFSWTPSAAQRGIYPGIHFEVTDGELTDFEDITITVGVTEQAVFSVSSLRINPTKANVGKKVSIRVIVTNSGNVAGTYEVILSINGVIEDRQTVTLTTGVTQEVKFNTVKNIPGTYKIDINGLTGSFVVVRNTRVS
jgi:hypothetical protein